MSPRIDHAAVKELAAVRAAQGAPPSAPAWLLYRRRCCAYWRFRQLSEVPSELGAFEVPLRPENEGAQLALGVVVGRVDTEAIDECPQGLHVRENVGARALDVLKPGLRGAIERGVHLLAYRYHPRHESLATELAVPVVVPVVEDDAGAVEEVSPTRREPAPRALRCDGLARDCRMRRARRSRQLPPIDPREWQRRQPSVGQ